MARKGWDALTDAYRRRLERSGVSQSAYESGTSLHKARGHRSSTYESFEKRARSFSKRYPTARPGWRTGDPADSAEVTFREIKAMGPQEGQAYMDYRRKMTRLYEQGDTDQAQTLYLRRKGSQHSEMWWYHGLFGG